MPFVFCLLFASFPKCLRPILASFLLMSLAPPITITVSLFLSVLTSLSAKFVTFNNPYLVTSTAVDRQQGTCYQNKINMIPCPTKSIKW